MKSAITPVSACTCFNCEDISPFAANTAEAEAAAADGWVLGVDPDAGANAVYACSACADLLINTVPVTPRYRRLT